MNFEKIKILSKQQGQSMVEMLIALPILLILIFGIVQWGFIARTKITLNTATELAARAGSLNHGNKSEILKAFSQAMVPLFMQGNDSAAGIAAGYVQARLAVNLNQQVRLTILNPSSAAWTKFKKRVVYPREQRAFTEITNDNLMYRPSTTQDLSNGLKLNLQDANLLKIKMDWCEELKVPIISSLIVDAASGLVPSAEQIRCNGVGAVLGKQMLAMQSMATYRMQTPFRNQ